MNVSMIGTGYVGLVTGTCFAELGNNVICADIDKERVEAINHGMAPIYEKDLDVMLKRNVARKRLRATADVREAVERSEVSFICVGTPSGLLDYIDLKYVEQASKDIGRALKEKKNYHLVVVKSTVVPGTTEYNVLPLVEKFSGKKAGHDFGAAMNPEFLREGNAIYDFMYPDRIIIGGVDEKSSETLRSLYKKFKCPIMLTNPKTAEMIKYATNSFLAAKISFVNEIGNICKILGIDAYDVAKGMGMDSRIGAKFLNAGIGFGGSCFPKDVKAIVNRAKEVYYRPVLLNAALEVNEAQPLRLIELLEKKAGSLRKKDVVVLGLAFKPGTDDMREAPSIKIVHGLLKKGARVHAADPKAVEQAEKIFGKQERLRLYSSAKEAVKRGKYVLIVTEWKEFKNKSLYRGKIVIDGRRIEEARAADYYEGVCW